ncbi:MAG: cytosine permease [Eubacteriales bacterium]|nr:cytosine permease [Eubacteriales bacterium]
MSEGKKGFGSVFFVFAGYVLSVTAFVLGGNVGNQLDFIHGVLALFVGNMILACYAGVLGYIGHRAQCSSTDMFKPVFGIRGQVISSTIVSLFSLVFISVYSALVGNMAASLFHLGSPFIGFFVYLAVIVFINLHGFKGMSLFSKFAVPAIGLFVVYGLFVINQKIGFGNITSIQPASPAPFMKVVSVVAASWMTGATFSSDIVRFLKKPNMVWVVTAGSFVCVTVLETVGLLCALGTGAGDIVQILGDLNMSAVAFVIYLLLTITSGQAVLYIAAQALENITKVVRNAGSEGDGKFSARFFIVPSCVFAAVIGVFMLVNGFTQTFLSLLGTIGAAIPPVGGTIVSHFLVVEREYEKTFEHMPMYRAEAFISWIAGVIVSQFVSWGIKPLNGFLAAVIIYAVLRLIRKGK